jgi:hypothetical protein
MRLSDEDKSFLWDILDERIWKISKKDVPELQEKIAAMLK